MLNRLNGAMHAVVSYFLVVGLTGVLIWVTAYIRLTKLMAGTVGTTIPGDANRGSCSHLSAYLATCLVSGFGDR